MDRGQFRLTLIVGFWWAGILTGFHLSVNVYWLVGLLLLSAILVSLRLRNLLSGLLWIVLIAGTVLGWIRLTALHSVTLPTQTSITYRVLEDFQKYQNKYALDGLVEYRAIVDADFGAGKVVPVLLTLQQQQYSTASIGTLWSCDATLKSWKQVRKFAGFAKCANVPTQIQNHSRLQEFADAFRIGLREVTSDRSASDGAALLPGLVLGDTSAQSPELERDLQQAGLGHLTAVSGANVAIVLLGLEILLSYTRLSKSKRLIISAMAASFFMLVARPSPSVVRATAMALLGLASIWFGWQRVSLVILLLSVFGLLLLDPFLSTAIGFWLSTAATFGLIVLPKIWKVSVDSSWLYKSFSTALAAGLATLPILVAAGLSPSFVSIPANMLAEILVAPATLAGVMAAVLQTIANYLPLLNGIFHFSAELAADFARLPASLIVWIAQRSADSFLHIAVDSPVGLLLLIASSGLLWWLRRLGIAGHWIALVIAALISVSLFAHHQTAIWQPDWEIAVCDVGQGDATVLRTSNNRFVMVDVGGDSELVETCLRTLGVQEIEMFVASHFHADHVGAIQVLRAFSIQHVWIADSLAPAGMRDTVIRNFPTARVLTPQLGASVKIDNLQLTILQNPKLSSTSADGSTINNASLVLLATFPSAKILFTGDIESAAQTKLMSSLGNLDVDLVKVPHHGSAAQNPNFAAWTRAEFGWISAGVDNPYGHPALTTLGQYKAAQIQLFSTIDCGSIGFRLQSAQIAIQSQKVCSAL